MRVRARRFCLTKRAAAATAENRMRMSSARASVCYVEPELFSHKGENEQKDTVPCMLNMARQPGKRVNR